MSKINKALEKAKKEKLENWETTQEQDVSQISLATPKGQSMTKVQEPRWDRLESNRIITALERRELFDTYNLLRTQLLHKTRDQGWNAIMVTSAIPGEGKTTTAVNLGLCIAREAMQTALVVDMNLRSPKLGSILDLKTTKGLSDYLLDGASLSDLLVSPGQDKFVVLPAGRAIEGSTDILASPKMKSLVQELKSRYPDRYVLFDCPHILDMPDSLIFASYVDAVLMVVEAGRTPQDQIQKSLDTLQENNILGLVLNKIDRAHC